MYHFNSSLPLTNRDHPLIIKIATVSFIALHMIDYKLLLVGLSVFIVLHTVDYRLSLVWGFPFFIAFVCVTYGRLQILTYSVGLSVFYRFCSRCTWSITDSH